MTKPDIKIIDVHQLKNIMDTQEELCVIDVREPSEWQESRIARALHIPKDEITTKINTLVPDKNQPVYLYCKGGVRSLYAAQCLIDLDYKEVYSVDGGIMQWAMNNYPIEK